MIHYVVLYLLLFIVFRVIRAHEPWWIYITPLIGYAIGWLMSASYRFYSCLTEEGDSMSTRIRYESGEQEGLLQSVRVFKDSQGKEYRVLLNENTMTFTIMNLTDNLVHAQGRGPSPAVIRTKAKQTLESLGISFGEEKRTKAAANAS